MSSINTTLEALVRPLAVWVIAAITMTLSHGTAAQNNPAHPLETGVEIGRGLYLGEGETRFFAIHTDNQTGSPHGAVILIPDSGTHPDWPSVIRPLRTGLAGYGWTTISIDIPPATTLDTLQQAQTVIDGRINAAIDHLRTNGINNIALLGHGTGATAALKFLASGDSQRANALVGVGMLLGKSSPEDHPYSVDLLQKTTVPTLDIFGSRDLALVLQTAQSRRLAVKSSGTSAHRQPETVEFFKQTTIAQSPTVRRQGYVIYRQQRVEGANHDFYGMSTSLVKRVAGWLSRHAKGVAVSPTK